MFPSWLTHRPSPPFPSHPAYLKVGRDASPKAKRWEPLITGERKRLWGPLGKASCLSPHPAHHLFLPVIVLADASHRTQGLQVVIGLAGAEAV